MSLAVKPSSVSRSTRRSCFVKFAAGEQRAELVEENIFARLRDFVFRRDLAALDADVGEALDVADLKQLAARHQRNRLAALARAPGAPDAVDVIFHVVRQIVVEHHLHVVHVNAARGDVRGHEKFQAGLAELVHHAVAHRLRHVAVQPVGLITLRLRDGPPDRPPCAWCCRK